jgi:hypothetical protein
MADLSESMGLQRSDAESWMKTVWEALEEYKESCLKEETEEFADKWDDICTAMVWIREDLGLPDEVEVNGYDNS